MMCSKQEARRHNGNRDSAASRAHSKSGVADVKPARVEGREDGGRSPNNPFNPNPA